MRGIRILLTAAAALLACGGGDKQPVGPGELDRAGTYTLQTVDGKPLPYEFPGAPGIYLTAEAITLNPDSTWSGHVDQQTTDANGVHTATITNHGTYSIDDLLLTLRFSTGEAVGIYFTGDNELTSHNFGATWVFRR